MLDPSLLIALRDELGADFIDARVQKYYSELVMLDNGVVRELSINNNQGVGIRVIVKGTVGYSSTNSLEEMEVKKAILHAYKMAKASSKYSVQVDFYRRPTLKGKASSYFTINPEDVDLSEKVELLKNMDRIARNICGISSVILRYGYEADHRTYISSNGDHVEYSKRMLGVSARLVAHVEGVYEALHDQESGVAGWEFIKGFKWDEWITERAKLAVNTAKAGRIKPGKYDIVLDNEMVGLMLHEAFGHASEGDTVLAGGSVLRGKVGEKVASELVTIVDEGFVEGGDFVPYDDEGTPKRKVYMIKDGVLIGFLHSIVTAKLLGSEPTGNARVMSYRYPLLVRQTNTYMEPLDWKVEEMIKDMKKGLYVKGLGALGGEVNSLTGAFTFTSGPSYIVENGEPVKLVKGIMLSGLILETLKRVDAVGKDLLVRTSVFGGCGKDGQTVRVGDGGPHVRVRGFVIGGG